MIILPSAKGFPRKPALIKDPFFSSVKLLMHCDGSQGGTIFTDSSLVNKSITIRAEPAYYYSVGTVITTQSTAKFGTASLNTNAGILSFSKTDMNFTTAAWTVEFWMKPPSVSGYWYSDVFNSGYNPDLIIQLTAGRSIVLNGYLLGPYTDNYYNTNTWYHIALVRSNNTLYYFIDGVLSEAGDASSYYFTNGRSEFWIGRFSGLLDEIRITMGVARYTSNFSVPILAFPNS